ncbi:MAG TPA: serine/threonine-protein kinase, partial [Bryobacteraceae bacterium]|nr:serine/threonine-protein kinase [Bryobacteraceae bacterium]
MTPERWAQVREVLYAVLDLDPDQRAQYLDRISANDPGLREEVESYVLSHGEIDADFLRTIPGDDASPEGRPGLLGRLIGPYRIVEELGSGGMGEVYRAVRADDQYQKQVAVKIARRGFDTGSGLRRFKAERQILATLDHPHIARLLDGGSTEDGLPYVVMELVEGVPIDEYCEAHHLSLVERLQLFRLLCGAVHYAHQHLVVHCDLKPGNILVTEEGVPKLLDFGIAKLLAPENFWQPSEHSTVVRVMTPEFASPEQVRGEPITTAADVYLLGVVLYRLLTGRSPYRVTSGAPHEMARVICETEPQRPSAAIGREGQAGAESGGTQEARRLRRRLAGDLDNIVLMALRKEPHRRYASAAQFAEDIRRHLEALPVVARKNTLGYRAGKFAARHKLGVAATALAIVAAAAGMGVVLWEAQIARAQRARAEEHFQDVRALADSLLFEVHDAIQDLPGATPARRLIVQKSIDYLRHLSKDSAGDVSLERELANAYERIGLVQGNPEGSNLGDVAGALDSLTKALVMRQKLAASASGTNAADLIQLAASYREVCGLNARYVGNIQAALDNCGKALGILQGLGVRGRGVKAELAKAYEAMGGVYGENSTVGNAGDSYAALENHRKALGLVDELVDAASADPDLLHWQGRLRLVTADDLFQTGQVPQALPLYEKATVALEALARGNNNTTYGHTLMRAYQRMGDMLLTGGRYTESVPYYRMQLQTAERLVALDPRNLVFRTDLAASRATYGHALWRAGRVSEGLASLRRGLVEIGDSARTDSRSKGLESQLILWMAGAQERAGDWSGALRNYLLARDAYDAVCRSDPRDVEDCLMIPGILDC